MKVLKWCDFKFSFWWDGYLTLEGVSASELIAMKEWLKDNVTNRYKIRNKTIKCNEWNIVRGNSLGVRMRKKIVVINFEYKEDATAFKLRWL